MMPSNRRACFFCKGVSHPHSPERPIPSSRFAIVFYLYFLKNVLDVLRAFEKWSYAQVHKLDLGHVAQAMTDNLPRG